jgi:hypothetical protein
MECAASHSKQCSHAGGSAVTSVSQAATLVCESTAMESIFKGSASQSNVWQGVWLRGGVSLG